MSFTPSEEEQKYFQQREKEKRERIRKDLTTAALEVQEARKVADTVGTEKDEVVQRLRALGFDGDTARVFDLMPLVFVAWADGSVSARERRSIMKVVEKRGIEPGSHASQLVETLLEREPSPAFLDETLALLREIVGMSGERADDIVGLSVQVAEASGGLLGLVGERVSTEERDLIQHIADQLGEKAQTAFHQRFDD